MSTVTNNKPSTEGMPTSKPKPPLGPPHDAFATALIVISFAAVIYFLGDPKDELAWLSWSALILCLATLIGSFQYFIRAYGFASQGWNENTPMGITFFFPASLIFLSMLIAPALHTAFADESLFGLVLSCLALAVLIMAPFRMALGKAPSPESPST